MADDIKRIRYDIVELTPGKEGDHERLVEHYDNRGDAQSVLDTLELVNVGFRCYKIKEVIL
jgi:hypothetical protein